jgi:endonuclease/exonuclease/phosphatase family metal-dependent hydrolase
MKLKVVSFNILCGEKENYRFKDRASRLRRALQPLDPDVIGLQEYRDAWAPHIGEQFSDYDMYNAWRSEGSDRESGPILWKRDRFELLNTGHFWFSDTPEVMSGNEWDEVFHCYRICAYVILQEKQTGTTFAVMNTHFGFGDKGQVNSARLIKRYADALAPLPLLITGDFNARPDSPAYAEMTRHFTDVNAATVNDTRNTYHGFTLDQYLDEHIDYCFVNDKVMPLTQKRIDEQVDGYPLSDHYGLYMELDL